MKRGRPRGRGRFGRIEKPFSQLTIKVRQEERPDGQQSQSDRPAPADQPHLGQPLVRRHKEYGKLLHEDLKIREFIKNNARRPASPAS
jgi:predicted Zn-dependent protease